MNINQIQFLNVDFFYDSKSLLFNQFNLTLSSDKNYLITGPSGCGKSTLMKLASGHIFPQKGSISFNNEPIHKPSLDIIYVQQESDLFDWLTVSDHIFLIKKWGINVSKAEDLLNQFGLESHKDKLPYQLSVGQKRRLAIIRAILVNPRFLILDETLSSLDFDRREETIKLLVQWALENQTSIITITHFEEDFVPYNFIKIKLGS